MSVDNPYYFNNVGECAKSPDSPSKGFSFFKKRNSANKIITSPKTKMGPISSNSTPDTATMGSRRGSLRSLLRTKSTNSSVTYSQGIVIGETRPPVVYDRQSGSNNYRDRLGSYNESICYSGSDDVFLQDHHNTFRSIDYNMSRMENSGGSTTSGLRRHSIGTFMNKERMRCGSISDEVPKMEAPKPPVTIMTRKGSKCNRIMDDILIVTSRQSEPAILWANYLKTRFDKITKQRGRISFNFLHVKLDEGNLSTDVIQRCLSTKLQIIILCSSLLALPHSLLMSQLSSILKPDKVLGLLLEISEEKILEIHKQAIPCYKQWRRCVVRNQDQSFIGSVLGIATDILGPALRDQPLSSSVGTVVNKPMLHESFTVLPRKVKIGQNKVVALLTEPLQREDVVHIKIEKTGEMIDIENIKRRNPYTLQFTIPESCMEVSMMIDIHIEKNEKELGSRPIKCESRLRELEQILRSQDSPMDFICHSLGVSINDRDKLDLILLQSFQKNIPPNFHLLTVSDEKQGTFMSHRESSPEEYPTLLHFSAKWGLDRLTMQLLDCPGGDVASSMRNINGKTPLELAEIGGHQKLVETLKNFSQMHEFTTMYHYFKGISESTPNKVIVEPKGELKLSVQKPKSECNATLELYKKQPEYMEMTGSSSGSEHDLYGPINAVTNLNYINIENDVKDHNSNTKEVSEDVCDGIHNLRLDAEPEVMTNELRINEPAYYESTDTNKPDDFSQECSNLLESASINTPDSCADYLIQPSNRPVTQQPVFGQDFGDYLTHPSNKPVEFGNSYMNDTIVSPNAKISTNPQRDDSHIKFTFKKREERSNTGNDGHKSNTLRRQGSDTSKISVDDELLEIINDFKNNVFTINEVEQLVSTWKNRNDVQQSFKDKQTQLQKMREEYERIQTQMKERMKRPTPFERVKKLFSRNKNQDKVQEKITEENQTTEMKLQSHRPMSSLSLHSVSSSSSSGRMSTGSACSGTSMGDSGTHSDHEDRRQLYTNCRVGHPGSLMDNYVIPPTPRPVTITTPASTPGEERDKLHFCTGGKPGTPINASEHYIIFPSNTPVHAASDAKSFTHDYMNFNGLNTIDEAKESDIPITVQPIKIQRNDSIYSPIIRKIDPCSSFKVSSPIANIDGDCVHFEKKYSFSGSYNLSSQPSAKKHEEIEEMGVSAAKLKDLVNNINELDVKTAENINIFTKTIKECNESLTRQNSEENNSNSEEPNHDYMNVTISS